MNTICSKCKTNPAVVFITKMEGDKTTNEGLCLLCAKELGIAPLNQMMNQLGVKEDDLEALNNQMSEFMSNISEVASEEEIQNMFDSTQMEEGSAPTAPLGFLNNLFGGAQESSEKGKTQPPKTGKQSKKKSMLDTYGTNLTAKAALGEVDRVVNRTGEIDRVIQILNRRSKNNPVLLGEPGVGKTAIAEGLACRIFEKNVPPKLFGYQLYLLDFTAIVAGTQFRGQFEARLKSILEEAHKMGNVILIIDEIHNIVAAGDAEGAMSAANILKPALAKGEIQVIGATTLTEYRKHIEKDSALERRFQPVMVDEPSIDESIEILTGIRDYYENYHKVKISNEVIEYAVKMSERYITDRFLPDKAIDVIDEAGSKVNLKNKALYEVAKLSEELAAMESQQEEAASKEDFAMLAELRSHEIKMKQELEQANIEAQKAVLTKEDIAEVIEGWTKIPVQSITEDETIKLLDLETRIHQRVIGQDEAVSAVARAIRRGRADINKRKRPVSFIFAGPTGVGKTELVKTIAQVMFNNEDALIRIDMSEYMEKHSVSKLIGSPPGYVGYDDAGQLTEKVRRKPYSVILLDEIEKAHPEVFNLFLQVLDDGRVADSHGKIINFENTIIIMTTNAGSEKSGGALGFANDDSQKISSNVNESLKRLFRPEFLNRIDEIVTFKSLTREEMQQIIILMLKDIIDSIEEKGAKLVVTQKACDVILDKGYDPKYGARPLKRSIQRLLEDKLAQLALTKQINVGAVITADGNDGEIVLTVVNNA